MDEIKAATRELMDREVRLLKESKAKLEIDVSLLRRKNDEIMNEMGDLRIELQNVQSAKFSELADLKSELKMKNFEFLKLTVAYEVG
jgi:hypothetical protein